MSYKINIAYIYRSRLEGWTMGPGGPESRIQFLYALTAGSASGSSGFVLTASENRNG